MSASNKKIIELVDKVIKLTSLDKSELNIMGKNGYNFYKANYHSSIRRAQLLSLFK